MENMTIQELIEMLIQIEKKYPNNYDLGNYIREFIRTKINK